MLKYCFAAACLLCLVSVAAKDFCLLFDFAEPELEIVGQGTMPVKGRFFPSADADDDNPETRAVTSYRKAGRDSGKKALFFDAEKESYAVVDTVPALATESQAKFYVRVDAKLGGKSIQFLAGNKADSVHAGFALFKWGNAWRFSYGDGEQTHTVQVRSKAGIAGQWTTLEVEFDGGEVTLIEGGQVLGKVSKPGKVIAANNRQLFIGNYVTSNKRAYASEGGYQLLVLSSSAKAAEPWLKQVGAQTVKLGSEWKVKALCEPVDGNEIHFQGQKTLHTFYDAPVPVTFMMIFQDQPAARLRLVLPGEVKLLQAFASNHNKPPALFLLSEKMLPDGRREYVTLPGELRADFPDASMGRGENVTVALDCPRSFQSGMVEWEVLDGEEPVHQDAFLLVAAELPPALPPGRFHYMGYTIYDIAFYDPALVDSMGKLYSNNGIIGKGRYYKQDQRRCTVDDRLAAFGFEFYEISLWSGPARSRQAYGEFVPAAINDNGEELPINCPTQLVASEAANKLYQEGVAAKLLLQNTRAVILDYEPWSAPARYCFCSHCLEVFRQRAGLAADVELSAAIIKRQYRNEWVSHWLENTRNYQKMMADAVHEMDPEMEIWDYTYVYSYDDAEALQRRQWSIPKDPRRTEDFISCAMLSLYHINGRNALDQLELSRQHLRRQICGISLISRSNARGGSYTTVEECLSPAQLRQKAVMAGALGHELFGIYPGSWIDGSAHVSLNQAAREVRQREDFYVRGKRLANDQLVTSKAGREQFACLLHESAGRRLATLFNFSDQTITATVAGQGEVSIEPHGVTFVELR